MLGLHAISGRALSSSKQGAAPPAAALDDGDSWARSQYGFVNVPIATALAALSVAVAAQGAFLRPADENLQRAGNISEFQGITPIGDDRPPPLFNDDDGFAPPRALDEGFWIPPTPEGGRPVVYLFTHQDEVSPKVEDEYEWSAPLGQPQPVVWLPPIDDEFVPPVVQVTGDVEWLPNFIPQPVARIPIFPDDVSLPTPVLPNLRDDISSVENTNTTTHTILLPPVVVAGDLLLVYAAFDGAPVVTWDNTSHGTWTLQRDVANGTDVKLVIYAKVADGTEGGGSLSITTNVSEQSVHRSAAYKDWQGTLADGLHVPATAAGTSTLPNPPGAADSWGFVGRATIAVSANDAQATVVSYPSGYIESQFNDTSGGGAGCGLATCRRSAIEDSQDPGTYEISSSQAWLTATVSIRSPLGPIEAAERSWPVIWPDKGEIVIVDFPPGAASAPDLEAPAVAHESYEWQAQWAIQPNVQAPSWVDDDIVPQPPAPLAPDDDGWTAQAASLDRPFVWVPFSEDEPTPSVVDEEYEWQAQWVRPPLAPEPSQTDESIVPQPPAPFFADEDGWVARAGTQIVPVVDVPQVQDDIVPQPPTATIAEDDWSIIWAERDEIVVVSFPQGGASAPDAAPPLQIVEEDWRVWTPPLPPVHPLYLPDREHIPAGSLVGPSYPSAFPAHTAQRADEKTVFVSWASDEAFPQPPVPLQIVEEDWGVWTPPLVAAAPLYLPDPEQFPAKAVTEEEYWHTLAPQPPTLVAPLWSEDDQITSNSLPFEEDWNVWTPPLETARGLYLPDPEQFAQLVPLEIVEEDWNVWTPPLVNAQALHLPDPEQIPAGLVAPVSEWRTVWAINLIDGRLVPLLINNQQLSSTVVGVYLTPL